MMRYLYLFVCVAFLIFPAHAQENHFVVETGVAYGTSDYGLGFSGDAEYNPSWSIKVGRSVNLSSNFNIVWGLRYNLISDVEDNQVWNLLPRDRPAYTRSRVRQHFVSLPVQFLHHAKGFYLFFGPELGFAVRSTVITDSWEGINGREREQQSTAVNGSFSDVNALVTMGIGKNWRLGNQKLYSQFAIGQSVLSQEVFLARSRSGYIREFFFSTGIRL